MRRDSPLDLNALKVNGLLISFYSRHLPPTRLIEHPWQNLGSTHHWQLLHCCGEPIELLLVVALCFEPAQLD